MHRKDYGTDGLNTISLVTQVLGSSIVTLVVALRFIVKFSLRMPWVGEDVWCIVAWILYNVHGACAIVYTYIEGPTTSHMTPADVATKSKVFYVASLVFSPMMLSIKLTILYVLTRLFHRFHRVYIVYIFEVLLTLYYIAILIAKVFICNPVSAYWAVVHPRWNEQCRDRRGVIIADSSVSVATDLAILGFSVALTWPLRMERKQKLSVIAVLGAGSAAVGFSLYRLVLVLGFSMGEQMRLILRILMSDTAEGGIGLICACVPTLKKLVEVVVGKYHTERQEDTQSDQGPIVSSEHAPPELNPIPSSISGVS
ncbi:hypothetical protein P168DRAFT_329722 [Aspergillus campestris IBT 28561]|uniref:Rhodopsin domain-containing protein n=1 Tax=Aspergillus campestris (strain IBT 28561) TaxID=1392248 RepID=A0A2I1CW28_ASPC2|nr:uncharacterized protein P168DRAFT_329722 [Aspergillus campestris IBT 28561]PKY01814.1 hypothetical protein P168DRAFT_329722 [Aspergillus campestris IBT 28561]